MGGNVEDDDGSAGCGGAAKDPESLVGVILAGIDINVELGLGLAPGNQSQQSGCPEKNLLHQRLAGGGGGGGLNILYQKNKKIPKGTTHEHRRKTMASWFDGEVEMTDKKEKTEGCCKCKQDKPIDKIERWDNPGWVCEDCCLKEKEGDHK